jgi:hypothetical protein
MAFDTKGSKKHKSTSASAMKVKNQQKKISSEEKLNIKCNQWT